MRSTIVRNQSAYVVHNGVHVSSSKKPCLNGPFTYDLKAEQNYEQKPNPNPGLGKSYAASWFWQRSRSHTSQKHCFKQLETDEDRHAALSCRRRFPASPGAATRRTEQRGSVGAFPVQPSRTAPGPAPRAPQDAPSLRSSQAGTGPGKVQQPQAAPTSRKKPPPSSVTQRSPHHLPVTIPGCAAAFSLTGQKVPSGASDKRIRLLFYFTFHGHKSFGNKKKRRNFSSRAALRRHRGVLCVQGRARAAAARLCSSRPAARVARLQTAVTCARLQ